MHHMGISLTAEQRARLEELTKTMGFRSLSNTVGRLIDLEFEGQAAYLEQKLQTAGAQNPDRKTK